MWKQWLADYCTFTRKDRMGILVLVSMICLVILLPVLWPARKLSTPSAEDRALVDAFNAATRKNDSMASRRPYQATATTDNRYTRERATSEVPITLFYFNPNTLDAAGWKRLGLRDKTAATIAHYLARGGKFRKPEDLRKVYGLSASDYERLQPFVQLPAVEEKAPTAFTNSAAQPFTREPMRRPASVNSGNTVIDVNQADSSAFIALPGIGSKLAARIINFRERLGGFYDSGQVGETYGLPDSTFQKIRSRLQCAPGAVKQLPLNTAEAKTLQQHPYIRWQLANAIIAYRNQHGPFSSLEALQQVSLVTPEIFAKLKPYLQLQ